MRHVVTKARVDKKRILSRGSPGDKRAREGIPGHYFSLESTLRRRVLCPGTAAAAG